MTISVRYCRIWVLSGLSIMDSRGTSAPRRETSWGAIAVLSDAIRSFLSSEEERARMEMKWAGFYYDLYMNLVAFLRLLKIFEERSLGACDTGEMITYAGNPTKRRGRGSTGACLSSPSKNYAETHAWKERSGRNEDWKTLKFNARHYCLWFQPFAWLECRSYCPSQRPEARIREFWVVCWCRFRCFFLRLLSVDESAMLRDGSARSFYYRSIPSIVVRGHRWSWSWAV